MKEVVPISPNARWVTPKQLAAALGVSPMTVYRLIDAGAIPVQRIGRRARIAAGTARRCVREGVEYPE